MLRIATTSLLVAEASCFSLPSGVARIGRVGGAGVVMQAEAAVAAEGDAEVAPAPPPAAPKAPAAPKGGIDSELGVYLPAGTRQLAEDLCPAIGYWDPLGLASADFWGQGQGHTRCTATPCTLH